jgi:hypothetical protein
MSAVATTPGSMGDSSTHLVWAVHYRAKQARLTQPDIMRQPISGPRQ